MKSENFSENDMAKFLAMRGVMPHDTCPTCNGLGSILYGNTATYFPHFIAGQAITRGVCNACWGSGTKTPWPSHLEFYKMKYVSTEAKDLAELIRSAGSWQGLEFFTKEQWETLMKVLPNDS